eukprot:3154922-Amphidinium_carterae.1
MMEPTSVKRRLSPVTVLAAWQLPPPPCLAPATPGADGTKEGYLYYLLRSYWQARAYWRGTKVARASPRLSLQGLESKLPGVRRSVVSLEVSSLFDASSRMRNLQRRNQLIFLPIPPTSTPLGTATLVTDWPLHGASVHQVNGQLFRMKVPIPAQNVGELPCQVGVQRLPQYIAGSCPQPVR